MQHSRLRLVLAGCSAAAPVTPLLFLRAATAQVDTRVSCGTTVAQSASVCTNLQHFLVSWSLGGSMLRRRRRRSLHEHGTRRQFARQESERHPSSHLVELSSLAGRQLLALGRSRLRLLLAGLSLLLVALNSSNSGSGSAFAAALRASRFHWRRSSAAGGGGGRGGAANTSGLHGSLRQRELLRQHELNAWRLHAARPASAKRKASGVDAPHQQKVHLADLLESPVGDLSCEHVEALRGHLRRHTRCRDFGSCSRWRVSQRQSGHSDQCSRLLSYIAVAPHGGWRAAKRRTEQASERITPRIRFMELMRSDARAGSDVQCHRFCLTCAEAGRCGMLLKRAATI